MAMPDSDAKKKWVKENVLKLTFKLFREIGSNRNDQEIIDFLDDKNKSEVIKAALREYIQNHKGD